MNRSRREILLMTAILVGVVALLVPLGVNQLRAQPGGTNRPAATSPTGDAPGAGSSSANLSRLVIGETGAGGAATTLWSLDPFAPDDRREIARIDHQPGYPPTGSVSPDGARLALYRVPPGASEQQARSNGGEVWVVDLASGALTQFAAQAGFVIEWAPDGQSLVYGARIPPDDPQDNQAPFRTVFTLSGLDGSAPVTILSDTNSAAPQPLGWSADGQRFYSASYDQSGWALDYWDRSSQELVAGAPLAEPGLVRSFSLSPDGERLLLNVIDQDGEELILVNLTDGAKQSVAVLPAGAPEGARLGALWSADGQRLLVRNPGEALELQMRLFSPDGPQSAPSPFQAIQGQENPLLTPIRWSPDGAWIVLRDYGATDLAVYLQQAGSAHLTALRGQVNGATLSIYGWATP